MNEEKIKMLAGKPYKAFGDLLFSERQKAKKLCYHYNTLHPSDLELQKEILKNIFSKIGDNFTIEQAFRCDYGYNIEIGNNFFANYNLLILDCAKVIIGDNVLIGPNVSIYTAGHPVHFETRNLGFEYAFPITIGDNVWIGGNVVINPGVTIGKNSVIGSGSVVTKDIPADVVAVGNPCRVIKVISDEDKKYYFKMLTF
jgi:acetyltransferase-like isoleucine patch superfamily enzyme